METILLVISIGTMNILCFFIGAKLGQTVANNKTIKAPNLNPITAINNIKNDYIETKEKKKENEYYKALTQNIDNYDGTGIGQVDLPRK